MFWKHLAASTAYERASEISYTVRSTLQTLIAGYSSASPRHPLEPWAGCFLPTPTPSQPHLLTIDSNASWDNNNHRDAPAMEESRKGYCRQIQSKLTLVFPLMASTTSARQIPMLICLSIRLSIGNQSVS